MLRQNRQNQGEGLKQNGKSNTFHPHRHRIGTTLTRTEFPLNIENP